MPKNANSGYSGYSMSNRAVNAYENGERPLSKWTKKDIIDTIATQVKDLDKDNLINLETLIKSLNKLSVKDLKDNFLTYTSWHHTSKFYNITDFYAIDLDNKFSNVIDIVSYVNSILEKSNKLDSSKTYVTSLYLINKNEELYKVIYYSIDSNNTPSLNIDPNNEIDKVENKESYASPKLEWYDNYYIKMTDNDLDLFPEDLNRTKQIKSLSKEITDYCSSFGMTLLSYNTIKDTLSKINNIFDNLIYSIKLYIIDNKTTVIYLDMQDIEKSFGKDFLDRLNKFNKLNRKYFLVADLNKLDNKLDSFIIYEDNINAKISSNSASLLSLKFMSSPFIYKTILENKDSNFKDLFNLLLRTKVIRTKEDLLNNYGNEQGDTILMQNIMYRDTYQSIDGIYYYRISDSKIIDTILLSTKAFKSFTLDRLENIVKLVNSNKNY